jgi:hypothetical protein
MCSSNTCDMYMCRLRHINDPVLSSLKMESIRLLFIWNFNSFIHNNSTLLSYHVLREESPLYHTLFQIRLQVVTDNKVGTFTVIHSFIHSFFHLFIFSINGLSYGRSIISSMSSCPQGVS